MNLNYKVFYLIAILYVGYCSSVIIDENQLSFAHNIMITTKLKFKQKNSRPKWLLLQASAYLSIVPNADIGVSFQQ